MKIEEAIKIIENESYPNAEREELLSANESFRIAIEALEKRIPKNLDRDEKMKWICPTCSWGLYYESGKNYCQYCGQAIKWED